MKRKVSRVEAIIIMKAAKEFREKNANPLPVIEPVLVPEVIEPIAPPKKKTLITYIVDLFRKKGS